MIARRRAQARHFVPPPPPSWAATAQQSERVLQCLTRAGLAHVSAASRELWSGYTAKVGTFVYVYLYGTNAAATSHARRLSAQEVATAGRYVVNQSIAPYAGSPVAAVTVCLGGKPPKVGGSNKGKKAFTF